MRLPFLQLESDFIAHGAAEVAAMAGCTPAQAIGHVALLRAWAVSHATDAAPPDGRVPGDVAARRIEAAAQWTGERGALLQALLDAGQVSREGSGLRVLHLEPYVKAWEENLKAKERMRKAREEAAKRKADEAARSANITATTDERSTKFTGQTQMQTQNGKGEEEVKIHSPPLPSSVSAAPTEDRPPLELVPSGPPVSRKTARADEVPSGVLELQAVWNEVAVPLGLQRWVALSEARLKHARAAVEAVPSMPKWRAFLAATLPGQFYLGGADGNGWKADVDWLLTGKTRAKVADFDPTLRPPVPNPSGPPANFNPRNGNVPAEWNDHTAHPITEL